MGIPQELSTNEDDVCLAFLQVTISLFAVEDKSDSANREVGKGLLNSSGEGNL